MKLCGKFSAVSVPTKFGKQGIGKALVTGAESKLVEIAQEQLLIKKSAGDDGIKLSVVMEMGVINLRTDLFPWYEKQGYSIIGEFLPRDKEVEMIKLPDVEVHCILMRKQLSATS